MLFLHIGMHKTGTTFLQKAVFPLWTGIEYLPSDKLEYLTRMEEGTTYLLSREGLSGQNWMHADRRRDCIDRLAGMLPDARILLSFRRHSGYVISSYNQYLQRGGYLPFSEYFDIENDSGFMKREDFIFRDKIDAVERAFGAFPYVMLHDDIVNDLSGLLENLQRYIGGKAPAVESIVKKRHNKSVGYYPSKLLRYLNSKSRTRFNPGGRLDLYHWRLRRLNLDPRSICQYALGFIPDKSILTVEERRRIDDYYREDWAFVQRAAKRWTDGCYDPAGEGLQPVRKARCS